MKTLLIILITFVVSQHLFQHYGSHNIISQTTDTCLSGIRWVLTAALHWIN